jgi:hypothetical protein
MKRIFLRTLAVCLLVVLAFVLIAFSGYSRGAESYPAAKSIALAHRLRNWAEHDAIIEKTWPKPYILETGNVVFYGIHHTNDRNDPQLADVARRWEAFKPTVALCEGRSRSQFIGPIMSRLGTMNEVRFVHGLARRDDVPLYSLEPAYADEVDALLKKWTPEQIALYFTMRVYWSEAGGNANESLALDLLRKRTDVPSLRNSINDVAGIDRVWKRDFARLGDWRTMKEEPKNTYLAEISDDSRQVRGEHMARTIIDLSRRGERVFAVVGSGHVVRTEWILREALGAPPAPDQPRSASASRTMPAAKTTSTTARTRIVPTYQAPVSHSLERPMSSAVVTLQPMSTMKKTTANATAAAGVTTQALAMFGTPTMSQKR